MADALNDDEQLERLREWWQQNWLPLVLGLGLAIAGVLGWNLWQSWQKEQAELASGHFEQLRLHLQMGNIGQAIDQVDILKSGYSKTPYAAQGALLIAKGHIDNRNFDKAATQLEWVANYADDSKLQHVGRLRLARTRWAQGETETALDLLESVKLESFAGLYAELRGDILASLGRNDDAREAYKLAMQSADVSDLAVLQQKLADLETMGQQAAAESTDDGAATE